MSRSDGFSRRQFLKNSSVAAAVSTFPAINQGLGAKGDDKVRVGVIGCGGRGTGAALNVLLAPTKVIYPPPRSGYHTENAKPGATIQAKNIEVVALADLFQDRQIAGCTNRVTNEVTGTKGSSNCDASFPEVATPRNYKFY